MEAPRRRRARAVLVTVRRALARAWAAVRGYRPRHGWWAAVGLVVAALVVSVVVGVTTASAQGALGPHVTRYDVTTDSTVTIDFGPLGTLQLDSPLPLTLGVRATVQEIPASVTELGEARTLQALSEDLNAYLAFFSGPAAAVQDVANALVRDALVGSAVTFVVLVAAWWVGWALLGAERRHQLGARLARRARPLTAAALAVALGCTVLTSSLAPPDRPEQPRLASAVFEGTPLAGARVTGRLGGVIDTYGTYAVDAWRANEQFYRSAQEALVAAWDDRPTQDAALALEEAQRAAASAVGASSDDDGRTDGDPADEGTDGAGDDDARTDGDGTDLGGAADDTVSDLAPEGADADLAEDLAGTTTDPTATPTSTRTPSPTPTPAPPVDPVTLVVVSDLHCNVGMAPLIGTLAELSGAEVVLDAGDTTMNGTSVEQYCVTSFARAIPSGVTLVTSPGNHDSRETSENYARAGATVLAGEVVEVAGVRILGDSDPNETRVGAGGTSQSADETPAEASRRLADVACEDGAVDLLLVHTPAVGTDALDEGCVPAQVSGHYHRRSGPEQVGLGIRYISSSTAGATLNQPTVGPLRGVAEMTVLRFDRESRRFIDHQVVRVGPDASVSVEQPRYWPLPVPPVDEEPAEGSDEEPGAERDGAAGGAAVPSPRPTASRDPGS